MPDFDVITHKHLFDISSNAVKPNTPPPPAPRLQATQLPLDDIPEMSLLDSFPGIDEQASNFAASLKAAGVRNSACGAPAVATPASLLFGIQPEPVSMQVQMPAFGYSGSGIDGCALSLVHHIPWVRQRRDRKSTFFGSPGGSQATPKQAEYNATPRTDGNFGAFGG